MNYQHLSHKLTQAVETIKIHFNMAHTSSDIEM